MYKLESLLTTILWAMFGLNWPRACGEDVNVFFLFIYPLVEQTSTPSTQGCYCSEEVTVSLLSAFGRSLQSFEYRLKSPSHKDILCHTCLKSNYTGDSGEK